VGDYKISKANFLKQAESRKTLLANSHKILMMEGEKN